MYKTSLPKESITFVEPKDDKEDIKKDLHLLRIEYNDLKRRYEELKKRYINQNDELLRTKLELSKERGKEDEERE